MPIIIDEPIRSQHIKNEWNFDCRCHRCRSSSNSPLNQLKCQTCLQNSLQKSSLTWNCINCNNNTFDTIDNISICTNCGNSINILIQNSSFKDSERINIIPKYTYNHFKLLQEWKSMILLFQIFSSINSGVHGSIN